MTMSILFEMYTKCFLFENSTNYSLCLFLSIHLFLCKTYNLLGLYEREPEKSIYNLKSKIELSRIAFCVVKGGLKDF